MINLLHGDCLELLPGIPDKSIDFILTDPPYGTTACKWDVVIPFDKMWEQLNRIIKPRGAIALFGSEPFSSALRMSNIKNYKYDWIWEKENNSNFFQAKFRPLTKYEFISVFGDFGTNNGTKKHPFYFPQGIKAENTTRKNGISVGGKIGAEHKTSMTQGRVYIQEFSNYPEVLLKYNRDKNTTHPTQKPVSLLEYLIKTYTLEGDTILDFTMGSGSTGVACLNTGRNFIGIEKDDKYFEIASRRINDHTITS